MSPNPDPSTLRTITAVSVLAVFTLLAAGSSTLAAGPATVSAPVPNRGDTPLHTAALAGRLTEVERLLRDGADPRATNTLGATPLHYATGDSRIVRLLLQAGADPNARSQLETTPLHTASGRPGSLPMVRLLVEAGANVNAVMQKDPGTPLSLAASMSERDTVRYLLRRGADPNSPTNLAPISQAAFAGDLRIVQDLVAAGATLDPDDGFAGTPVNIAFYGGHRAIAEFLIRQGCDLHRKSTYGEAVPPMVWAAYTEEGDPTAARWLLERGVDVNEPTGSGHTALDWARRRGDTPVTRFLLEHGGQAGTNPYKEKEVPSNPVPPPGPGRERVVRNSIERAISLLQQSSDAFLENGFVQKSECVSCHQQTLPAVAFGRAWQRGFRLDEASLGRQLQRQQTTWSKRANRAYEMLPPQPDAPANLGYGMLGLRALAYAPDALTAAMSWYLASSQRADGSWPSFDRRPPMEEGPIVATALAVGALTSYPPTDSASTLAVILPRARQWLERARPANLNQEAFRLLGLRWADARPATLALLADQLRGQQRPDGGWAPLPGLRSDAWATGQALFALTEAGGVHATDPAYQRGVEFLLRTQFADGSWWVRSRTWPFQPQFDSRFPHGRDQWIAAGGTAWAILALLETLPADSGRLSMPLAQERISALGILSANNTSVAAASPAAAASPGFQKDILPILRQSCVDCHSGEKAKGQFRLDTREALMTPGQSGEAAVRPGHPDQSLLVRYVTDQVEDLEMPPLGRRNKFPALSKEQVRQLTDWIAAGAP